MNKSVIQFIQYSSGFSLTESLIALSLSIGMIALLIKLYFWQVQIQHKMDDMVFLDHNGVIAMLVLGDNTRKTDKAKITTGLNKIIFSNKLFYIKSKGLYFIENKNQSQQAVEIVSGADQLQAKWINQYALKISVNLVAPYGMSENFTEVIQKSG